MSASQARVLGILADLADARGRVPSMTIRELMDLAGMLRTSVRSRLWELVQAGCLERIDLRAPEGETGRFRITGKAPPEARAVPAATASFDSAAINRRLKERYGIEVITYQRDRYSEAISLPRVRALEGPAP